MAKPTDTIAKLKKAKSYWTQLQRGKIQSFLGWGQCKNLDEFIERVELSNPQLTITDTDPSDEPEQLTIKENSGYPEKLQPGQDGYLLQEAKKLPKDPSFDESIDFLSKIINEPKAKAKWKPAPVRDFFIEAMGEDKTNRIAQKLSDAIFNLKECIDLINVGCQYIYDLRNAKDQCQKLFNRFYYGTDEQNIGRAKNEPEA